MGAFTGLLQKRWVQILMIIVFLALVVETIIIVAILNNWSLGSQSFPRYSFNPPIIAICPTLTSHLISQNSQNRTLLFDCSTSTQKTAAFKVFAPFTPTYTHESGKSDRAKPIFTLPPGFLSLFITNDFDPQFSCVAPVQLTSGQSMIIGSYAMEYDYCAEISNSENQVASFNIDWVEGTGLQTLGPVTPRLDITESPANITISAGASATSSIDITSHWFKGPVYLMTYIYPSLFIPSLPVATLDMNVTSIGVNGSVHITLTITSTANTTKGTYAIHVEVQSPPAFWDVAVTVKIT